MAGMDDDYYRSIIASAPKKAAAPQAEMKPVGQGAGSTQYNLYVGGSYDDQADPYPNKCARVLVIVTAVLLTVAGGALAGYAQFMQHKQLPLPFCIRCANITLGATAAGAIVAAIGLLGLFSAKSRSRCAAYPYALLLIILGIVFAASGVAMVVFSVGGHKLDFYELWKDAVQKDPAAVCAIETSLGCSGYSSGCCSNNSAVGPSSTTTVAPSTNVSSPPGLQWSSLLLLLQSTNNGTNNTSGNLTCWTGSSAPAWYATDCPAVSCPAATNTPLPTCSAKIESDVKSHFVPLIGTVFGLALVAIASSCLSIRMVVRRREGNSDD